MRTDITFAGLHYNRASQEISESGCAFAVSDLLQWSTQVHMVAGGVASTTNLTTSVHLWTPCMRAADAARLFPTGPRFFVHESHDPELVTKIDAMKTAAQLRGRNAGLNEWIGDWRNNILKWSVFNLAADLVVFIDLDMEVMPHGLPSAAPAFSPDVSATREWVAMLRCANRSQWAMLSLPDHSAPVNTAFLIVKPSHALYREGLELLGRAAAGGFNVTHGWDLIGPPASVVPASDDSSRLQSPMRNRTRWDFVCAELDQGLIFHMLRVKHRVGADLHIACPLETPTPRKERAFLRHYAGGAKPAETLRRAARCSSMGNISTPIGMRRPAYSTRKASFWRLFRAAGRAKLRGVASEVARTISWGERTMDLATKLLNHAGRVSNTNERRSSACEASGELPPPLCRTLPIGLSGISTGLACLKVELAHFNVSINLRDGGITKIRAGAFLQELFPESRGGFHAAVPRNPELPHAMRFRFSLASRTSRARGRGNNRRRQSL